MTIFALDCAGATASAALLCGGVLLGESFTHVPLTHSQTLLPMAQELFSNCRVQPSEVDVFAVTNGPGSFTGVRIGVAAIKGMADAAEKPCFAVSALEAAAYANRHFDGVVCAVMDARRDQVYTACFRNGERLTEDKALSLADLAEELRAFSSAVLLAGDGTKKAFEFLTGALKTPCYEADEPLRFVRASSVAFLAAQKLEAGESPVPAGKLLPLYLRLPQAERELNNKQKDLQKKEHTK